MISPQSGHAKRTIAHSSIKPPTVLDQFGRMVVSPPLRTRTPQTQPLKFSEKIGET